MLEMMPFVSVKIRFLEIHLFVNLVVDLIVEEELLNILFKHFKMLTTIYRWKINVYAMNASVHFQNYNSRNWC